MCACVFKLNSDVRWPPFLFLFPWNFNFYIIPELHPFLSSCQHIHLWWILNEKRSAHLTVAVVKPCKRANHFILTSYSCPGKKRERERKGKHTHTFTRQKKTNADSNNSPPHLIHRRSLITHDTHKKKTRKKGEKKFAVRLMRAAFVCYRIRFICCCLLLLLSVWFPLILLFCCVLMFNYRRGLVFLLPQKPIWVHSFRIFPFLLIFLLCFLVSLIFLLSLSHLFSN